MADKSQAQRVRDIMLDCLHTDQEIGASEGGLPKGALIIEGIVARYGLHPGRVKENAGKILALITEVVPDDFLKSGGGGMSFLTLCVNRDGEQWAEHPTMGDLIVLGMAIGRAGYCLPRDLWGMLPGAVPYVWFDTAPLEEQVEGPQTVRVE